ncbi:MAG: GH25 family lysozyme [Mycobacteriaceae bacterium]
MDTLSNVRRSVLAGAPIAAALLILTTAATAATAHAAGPSRVAGPASAPVTHPDDDHLGSTIRAHEPSTSSPQAVTPNTAVPAAAGQPLGMDVSNYQGTVAWGSAVANGAQFVYIKATEGTGSLTGSSETTTPAPMTQD